MCIHLVLIKRNYFKMSTEEDERTFGISLFYPTISDNDKKHYS